MAALVVVGFLLSRLLGGSGGSGLTLAFENDGGDVYVLDDVTEAEDPPRDSRILRDASTTGQVLVAEGDQVRRFGRFGYEHDGGALFSYRENGDDEWTLAVLDGDEIVDIEGFDSAPAVRVTGSGAYLVDERSGSCSVLRLDGRETERLARADHCLINGSADLAILANRRSSTVEFFSLGLGSGDELELADLDDTGDFQILFSPSNSSVLVTSASGGGESILVDLGTGEVIADSELIGFEPTDNGFFTYDFSATTPVLEFVTADGAAEVISTDLLGWFQVSPSRGMVAIGEFDDGESILSMAEVTSDGVGPLTEVAVLPDVFDGEFIDDGRLLLVDSDGVVGVADGQDLTEIGELDDADGFSSPDVFSAGPDVFLVSNGGMVGVVKGGGNPEFRLVDDLEEFFDGDLRADGRWLVVNGTENVQREGRSLVLVDVNNLESAVIDEANRFSTIDFSDDFVYYVAEASSGRRETTRVALGLDGRPEDLTEDFTLDVPGDVPLQPWSWDDAFVTGG